MTLLWFDGCETYSNNTQAIRIPELSGSSISYVLASGRIVGNCIRIDNDTKRYKITPQNTPSDNTTIVFGFAWYVVTSGLWNYDSNKPFLVIYDDALNIHVGLWPKVNTNVLEVRNSAFTVLATGTYSFQPSTWVYFEVKITISDTVGVVQTKINEVIDINLSSADTKNGANGYVGEVRLLTPCQSKQSYYDDIYLLNSGGAKNNDFLGDVRVDVVRPNGAGANTDFSPSAGSNWENVDDTYPDDDTTYNDSQDVAAGEQDSYDMESLAVLGTTIHGVKDQITARKTDAGARSVKILTIQGGSDYLSATDIVLSDTYTTHTRIMEDNPDDAAAFVEADITSGEVGTEVTV